MSIPLETDKRVSGVGDDELARQVREGDSSAFDDLVLRYQTRIFNLTYRILNDHEEASDLTQEIFVKVHGAIGKFRGESSFSTWIHVVATNMCRNRLRKVRRIRSFETVSLDEQVETESGPMAPQLADPGQEPRELIERQEVREFVQRALAQLPEDFRMVMVMRDVQSMSYEEIAAAMDCSKGTVKSRLFRARDMVKEKLRRLYGHGA